MISQISIAGYKSIKYQKINLNPINILIGSNGVGKSNFISVFNLTKALYHQELSEYILKKGGVNNFLHFGKKNTQEIKLELEFTKTDEGIKNKLLIDLGIARDELYIKSIATGFCKGTHWHYQEHEKNIRESDLIYNHKGQAFWIHDYLNKFKVYHFHDTSDDSPIKSFCNVHDNRQLHRNGSNLASFLYFLSQKHPKHFFRIEKTIQSIAPFFQKFNLSPSELNESQIQLEWKEKGNSEGYFDAYSLSDGTLRFICLATLLLQPNPPSTIIIDEPELGLHPVAINKLAGLIHKISSRTQFIISTQSTDFIDNFEAEDIIVADRKDNATTLKHLDEDTLKDWLQTYSLSDVWRKNIIGGQPFNY